MWEKLNPDAEPLLKHSTPFPEFLYRYRSISPRTIERTIDFEIINESIFLAGLDDLNDPDEGRFIIQFEGSRRDIYRYCLKALETTAANIPIGDRIQIAKQRATEIFSAGMQPTADRVHELRQAIGKTLRVACFTTLPTNYSMWANYAKHMREDASSIDHGGICIEYRPDESWKTINLGPVVYSDDVPRVNPALRNEADIVSTVYKKSLEWRSESEWRVFMRIDCLPPFPKNLNTNSKIRIEGGVTGIIFGLKTPDEVVREVSRRAREKHPKISLRRLVHDPLTYRRVLLDLRESDY